VKRTENGQMCIQALGNTLLLSGYLMSDPVLLRALCASGSSLGIIFNVSRIPAVWPNVYWGCVFVLANTAMLVKLLLADVGLSFSEDELKMYETQFMHHDVAPRQFHQLLRAGEWRSAEAGEVLCVEGHPMDEVLLVHDGCVEVTMTGHEMPMKITGGDHGAFLGEASFLEVSGAKKEEELALTTVVCVVPTTYFVWESVQLRKLLRHDQVLGLQATLAFSLALVNKLRTTSTNGGEQHYRELLQVVVADGRIPPEEKRAVRQYRQRHGITKEQHSKVLQQVGWNDDEWEDGVKAERSIGQSRVVAKFWDMIGYDVSGGA